ncbi:MAG: DUF551 domain-containing protein [Roseburia sp.]|nr:DUF551 domain-containing protein [Roseburia sp.]
MVRLTHRGADGKPYKKPLDPDCGNCGTCGRTMHHMDLLVQALCGYEDTGLEPTQVITAKEMGAILCELEVLKRYRATGREPEEVKALLDELKYLRAEFVRLNKENFWLSTTEKTGWIAMADRLPPKEGSYLVCTARGAVCTAHYWDPHQKFSGRGLRVTHWMPLPEPVKEGRSG